MSAWEIVEEDYGDELWFGGSGHGLIEVNGWANGGCKKHPEQWRKLQSEARLIAAAPDLYEALKYAVGNPEFNSFEFDRLARAALAKVES
jgi:hypothetical protein